MAKQITIKQLRRALRRAPEEVEREGKIFLQRGLSEYKRVAVQQSPWRVGQSGGGIPRKSGNLREKHYTEIKGLTGYFGVNPDRVKYARRVHEGFKGTDSRGRKYDQEGRPWLEYARMQADNRVKKHYSKFLDNILDFIAQ